MWKCVPDPSTFSRAFDEFTQAKLAERVHEAPVQQHLGQTLTDCADYYAQNPIGQCSGLTKIEPSRIVTL